MAPILRQVKLPGAMLWQLVLGLEDTDEGANGGENGLTEVLTPRAGCSVKKVGPDEATAEVNPAAGCICTCAGWW